MQAAEFLAQPDEFVLAAFMFPEVDLSLLRKRPRWFVRSRFSSVCFMP
jgi:hypothetical protein